MIVIIGAGIAGLSLGWELVKAGAEVTIVDAGEIADGASGVATSYLEPRLGQTKMRLLERAALDLWPDWSKELQQRSGIDVAFREEGAIRVCLARNQPKFEKDITRIREQGRKVELLGNADIRKLEPSLHHGLIAGAYIPDVRWVDGKRVCEALAKLFVEMNGGVRTHWRADRIESSQKKIRVYGSNGELIEADTLVLANGMGANTVGGLPEDIPKCRAVRGVNLQLDMSGFPTPIRHLVKHHRGTLCPRGRNRLIVGTTYEPDVTDLAVGSDVINRLFDNAEDILPNVREMPVLEISSGVRTKIGDGKLYIGRSTLDARFAFSLSHAGAGFLRAPLIAKEFAVFLMNGTQEGFSTPFINGGL